MTHEKQCFTVLWEAKTGPRMLFGGPKARILRVFRSDPRLPRRIAKTIVFYGENRTLVGRRKGVLLPFHCEKATNVSAKIVPLAGLHHLRKPCRASKGPSNTCFSRRPSGASKSSLKKCLLDTKRHLFEGQTPPKEGEGARPARSLILAETFIVFLQVDNAKGEQEATGEPEVRI